MATKEVDTTEEKTEPGLSELYLASAMVKDENSLNHLEQIIKQHGGEIKKAESLGQKQLAYPINKQASLCLISVFFQASRDIIANLEKELNQDQLIERSLVTTWRGNPEAPERKVNKDRRNA
jgi:ribosomal protein S6